MLVTGSVLMFVFRDLKQHHSLPVRMGVYQTRFPAQVVSRQAHWIHGPTEESFPSPQCITEIVICGSWNNCRTGFLVCGGGSYCSMACQVEPSETSRRSCQDGKSGAVLYLGEWRLVSPLISSNLMDTWVLIPIRCLWLASLVPK